MRMLNAHTLEVDDPAIAVAEILKQLNLDNRLQKNAVGFITCSADYVETGMITAIREALPFEVAGCTTLTNANDQESGTMLLCLSVLTADDCSFTTAITPPLSGDTAGVPALIRESCQQAAARLGEQPGLILAFLPMLTTASGELMLEALTEGSGKTPVFGAIACDFDSTNYSNSSVIRNGQCSRNSLSMILIGGNVRPRFVVASISEQNLHRQHAVITASEGSILKEVNGMSAKEYLYSIGLLQGVGIEAASSLPFVVNYNDGSQPLARAIYALNDDGSASCGGVMPEGGTLAICHLDLADVLLTAGQSVTKLLENKEACGLIMFSCLGRNMTLGLTPMAEIEKVTEAMTGALPWHLAYAGGEACPVYTADGSSVNRFHNFTFIGCVI